MGTNLAFAHRRGVSRQPAYVILLFRIDMARAAENGRYITVERPT